MSGSIEPADREPALPRRSLLLGGLAGLALPAVARSAVPRPVPRPVPDPVRDPVHGSHEDPAVWSLTVVLVRHAEKLPGDDPELTPAGHAAAQWLAALLAAAPVAHLEHSPFRRTRQTLAPLAAATGVEPVVADPGDTAALRERLLALPSGSLAVVAGHSNTIPGAVAALGGTLGDLDEKGFIHDAVYDRLFVLTLVRWESGPGLTTTLELRFVPGV